MAYRIISQGGAVLRLNDSAVIPNDPDNRDRVEYNKWVAGGGIPEPYVAPIERRLVPKSLIISRLTDVQVTAAIGKMTDKQKERWRSPDRPSVYADDPETLAILKVIGADPNVILAP